MKPYKQYDRERIIEDQDAVVESESSADYEVIDDRLSLMPDKTAFRRLAKRKRVEVVDPQQEPEEISILHEDDLDSDDNVDLDDDLEDVDVARIPNADIEEESEPEENELDYETIFQNLNSHLNANEEEKAQEEEQEEERAEMFDEILNKAKSQTCQREELVFDLLKIYVRRKGCSKAILGDFISVLNPFLKDEDKLPEPINSFFDQLDKLIPPSKIKRHYYCEICEKEVGIKDGNKTCESCKSSNVVPYFILDIGQQIRNLFESSSISAKLQEIKSGDELLRFRKELAGKYDLLLTMNTDGLKLVKSKKNECWPVFFSIIQLPPSLRDRSIILGGIWFHDKKPPMNLYLKPIVLQIRRFFKYGLKWLNPISKSFEKSRIAVPLIVGDAPARSEMANMSYFSGTFGCQNCEIRTTTEPGAGRIYNYSDNDRKRTEESIKQHARAAAFLNKGKKKSAKKKMIKGVKGKSILSLLPMIDISKCFVSEFMHCFCLGVFRQFLQSIFFGDGEFSIKQFLEDFDEYLSGIKPPSFVHRRPRSLKENFKYFKASEFLFLFLFYSVPFLSNHLPDKYFDHYLLLVKGITLLLPDTITDAEIRKSEFYLRKFVKDAGPLYGNSFLTYNVHQLLHLPGHVRDFGSLTLWWAFPFESQNYVVARSVHGTKHFGAEITNRLSASLQLTALDYKLHGLGDDHVYGVSGNSLRWEDPTYDSWEKMNEAEKRFLSSISNLNLKKCKLAKKVKINKKFFTSRLYNEDLTTNDFTVQVFKDKFSYSVGSISFFLIQQETKHLYILMNLYDLDLNKYFKTKDRRCIITHIVQGKKSDKFYLFKLNDIKNLKHAVPVQDFLVFQLYDMRKNL